ncbi:MAG: hypothetical protein HC802_16645, partial [Caldilineaceae bacterium]|nr:hypothetical protein [Caldilineaceae bacterium]
TSNIDAAVLDAATRLIEGGAVLAPIVEQSLNRRPFSLVKLWGLVLPTVRLEERVIWATVSRLQLDAAGHAGVDAKLSSFLVTVDEADMSAVFAEKIEDGQAAVECSFRAKPGFNVSDLAFSFGGGGHPPASGCTILGELEQVAAQVVPALQQARRQQNLEAADMIRGQSA